MPFASGPAAQCDQRSLADLNDALADWRRLNRWADRALLAVLLVLAAMACWLLICGWRAESRGIVDADPRDFKTLLAINPDTVAWLMLDDTPIDHPVVQGKDNFEYLDKAFDGGFYVGGTLFLDAKNASDLSDPYNIIHGHHMAGKAMFSSLENFLKEGYFSSHRTGTLLTPRWDYDLQLLAAGVYDAYDGRVYSPGKKLPEEAIRNSIRQRPGWRKILEQQPSGLESSAPPAAKAKTSAQQTGAKSSAEQTGAKTSPQQSDAEPSPQQSGTATSSPRQILALSTCTGEMNDNRIVVFWAMTDRRKHEESKRNKQ